MTVGVVRESFPGERRVALVPGVIPSLKKAGLDIAIEAGAGERAGFLDLAFADKGARMASTREEVFGVADVILYVRTPGANPAHGRADLELLRPAHTIIGFAEPLIAGDMIRALADRGVTTLAMELMPRITRAQSMDALSAMATIAGYKAVLLAASTLPRMFPMLITAAGTIAPARVFVVGAGVAGLQAIASSRRLGAKVEAYDVRPAVKEQVQSLGARFVELPLEAGDAEDRGGYAKAQDESFYRRQREMMARVIALSDVVITTAAVPGKRSPVLVTAEMVAGMAPGSVIVDLAAERGGNCELTRPDESVVADGVTILGPTNLPATVPYHASQMYAKNITTFLLHLMKDGQLRLAEDDEIARETLVTRGGDIVNVRARSALGLEPVAKE
ncbi:MAG: Re/Si-specific NAD(P)(+) transhydrogenase subunit alpha [Acidobacteria bacterium]|nr:Re/Si-specific NAD(P)(+) transhydrogenase subunit alpha [Acidobacteriota bacterium]